MLLTYRLKKRKARFAGGPRKLESLILYLNDPQSEIPSKGIVVLESIGSSESGFHVSFDIIYKYTLHENAAITSATYHQTFRYSHDSSS